MEKAKAAVSDFMKKSGHHDTTVHETVAPGVTHDTVKPHHHEELQTAVDKETHQDHYHRTVQPVQDREILPEQHHAKLGAVQHRDFDHRDGAATKANLEREQAQFRDQRVTQDATQTQSANAAIGGEHVHHHIHETIQPVVQKETIEPHVTHTTVPIHEVHHNAAKHHETSTLPAVGMSEFKQKGGVLGGREERYDGFEGEPRNIGGHLSEKTLSAKRDSHHTPEALVRDSAHHNHGGATGTGAAGLGSTGASTTKTAGGAGLGSEFGREGTGHHHTGVPTESRSDYSRGAENPLNKEARREADISSGGGFGRDADKYGSEPHAHSQHGEQLGKKASLVDKINPKKDADGDGKAGFMK